MPEQLVFDTGGLCFAFKKPCECTIYRATEHQRHDKGSKIIVTGQSRQGQSMALNDTSITPTYASNRSNHKPYA